jgi:hypothetical protein
MTEEKPKKTKEKNPINMLFNLGPKDPVRKAKFDFILMGVILGAFIYITTIHLFNFFNNLVFASLGWAAVTGGISYFNYFGFVGMRERYLLVKSTQNKPTNKEVDDKMSLFDDPNEDESNMGAKQ